MSLAVIILNWNQAADAITCAQLVRGWTALSPRLWLVDNHSAPQSRQMLRDALPDAQIIYSERNRGFAGGNNLGIRAALDAGCAHILLLNNDAAIDAAGVARLQQTLRENPDVGVVGPPVWDADRPHVLLSAGGSDIGTTPGSHMQQPPAPGALRDVAYVPGACVLIRRELFEAVGLLDEAYFFGGEMADLCALGRQRGFRSVIDGGARAVHKVDRSAEVRRDLHIYYVVRNRFLFVRKHHARRRLRLYLFWTMHSIRPFLQALLHGDWRRARAIWLACWDGWRGRFGGQNARVSRGSIR